MPYNAKIYRIFIASPGDVSEERSLIRKAVIDWNALHASTQKIFLDPVGWETHSAPAMGDRPQAIINDQILEDADLLIAVFWTRLGTATGVHASGTVEEIEKHLAAGKPAMIYFSNAPVRPDSVESQQYDALKEFKRSLLARGLIESYENNLEFADKLRHQLHRTILSKFPPTVENPQATPAPVPLREAIGLSDDAISVLSHATKRGGFIMVFGNSFDLHIQIGENDVLDTSTPRLGAKWKSVLGELQQNGYIEDRNYKGEYFDVTEQGYQLIEALEAQASSDSGQP